MSSAGYYIRVVSKYWRQLFFFVAVAVAVAVA